MGKKVVISSAQSPGDRFLKFRFSAVVKKGGRGGKYKGSRPQACVINSRNAFFLDIL